MTTNHQIILNTILEQQRIEIASNTSENDYFNIFVTEQILKNYELSYDEIEGGVVDNGGDGGIDSIYTFVNSELLQRDSSVIDGKRNSIIDVYILQSKNTNGFGESAIEKCISSAIDLFDFSKDNEELLKVYNSDLVENREIFRKQYLHLASKFPLLNFHYFYATKGVEVHPNVERKVENLEKAIKNHFDKAEVNFEFLTAERLIELSRNEQIRAKNILLADNPISTQDGGYIAIAPLKNYYEFITTDETEELIKYFFDANIRDYQGSVEVNKAIKETLNQNEPNEDFWWLNNGITITATDASFASKRLNIEDPQIVNGLQTSFEIYNYFKNNEVQEENRNVLIRVVKTTDEKNRLNVIKSTNSQTNIPPASLRATDPIHRDIEDYLLAKGFYYDRRKNYYKNQGKPSNKIISIPYLAQIIMGILIQKPDYARARPSTLIKNNTDYEMIYDENMPIDLYYKTVVLHKTVVEHLRNYDPQRLTRIQIGDIQFHVSMYVAGKIISSINPTVNNISNMEIDSITSDIINEGIEHVYVIYDSLGGNNAVAKGKEFVKEVLEQLKQNLNEA